jgi:hypothetical protein
MIELRVGTVGTARWLKSAACMAATTAHACGVSGVAATMQTWTGTALRQSGQHSAHVYMTPTMARTSPDGHG